jgi:hypothetical protein
VVKRGLNNGSSSLLLAQMSGKIKDSNEMPVIEPRRVVIGKY